MSDPGGYTPVTVQWAFGDGGSATGEAVGHVYRRGMMRKLSDIKPYEQNPRVNDQAVDAVAASIREFGVRQPIVVDEAGVIIVGHTRLKAALKLGLESAPVHVADPASLRLQRRQDLSDLRQALPSFEHQWPSPMSSSALGDSPLT